MALSKSQGQFPKSCDLCEIEIKITCKCINCDLLLCTKCKEKVHSKIKSADKHKIIDIEEVGKYPRKLDFSNINCEDHEGQTCFMFCKSCDQLVCPQCIAEVHNGHGLVQISEGFKIKIENVKDIQQQRKSHIDELTNEVLKMKVLRKYENSKYTETRNLIQTQNAELKRELDKFTEKLIKELDQKWNTLQYSMEERERKVMDTKIKQEDQNAKLDDLMNSNDVDKILKDSKHMRKFMNETVEPVKLDFNTMPKFLPGEITEYNFGSLQDIPTGLEIKIHRQFETDIERIFFLSTCPDNSICISDQNVIQRVKPEGSNLKMIANFKMEIFGMAVTPSNDLLLGNGPRLKQISGSSGQVTDSVYIVDPLRITSVHVTTDYKVIVGARTPGPVWPATGRQVVIKMNKEGKLENTYEHDRNKQPIFTRVIHITSTTNDTIYVVDRLSDDNRGRIVVLGQEGDVINTYTGHRKINSDGKPFKPVSAVTTPLDNIIVPDPGAHTLHILNIVGHFITDYNTNNIGILRPYSLSFIRTGQLYIGCSRAKSRTDKAKLYKVDISQI